MLCAQHTHGGLHVAHPSSSQACAGVEPAPCHRAGWIIACTCRQPFLDKNEPARMKRRPPALCSGAGVELSPCAMADLKKAARRGAHFKRFVCSVHRMNQLSTSPALLSSGLRAGGQEEGTIVSGITELVRMIRRMVPCRTLNPPSGAKTAKPTPLPVRGLAPLARVPTSGRRRLGLSRGFRVCF